MTFSLRISTLNLSNSLQFLEPPQLLSQNKWFWVYLAAILCSASPSNALCLKQSELRKIGGEEYEKQLVATNACLEVSASIIQPDIVYGEPENFGRLRQYRVENCCCVVTNYSEQEVSIVG